MLCQQQSFLKMLGVNSIPLSNFDGESKGENGVNLTVQGLLRQDARIQDFYFNIFEMKLSITSLFSVQIMSYLGASDIIYSDEIDSFKSFVISLERLDRFEIA